MFDFKNILLIEIKFKSSVSLNILGIKRIIINKANNSTKNIITSNILS